MKPVVLMTDSRAYKTDKVEMIHLPFIGIEALPVLHSLFNRHYDWLILTSKNAVEMFFTHYPSVTFDYLAAIGKKTAEALRERGYAVDFMPAEFNQEAFINESGSRLNGCRILLPCSKDARPGLYHHLNQHAVVERLDLYQPVVKEANVHQAHHLIINHQVDYVTFMSPSAVKGYFSCYNNIERPVIAIGPVTGNALRQMNQPFVLAETSTKEAMIQKIIEMREDNEI